MTASSPHWNTQRNAKTDRQRPTGLAVSLIWEAAMALIYRLLHLAGWERWFEFGRASRWRWKPKLTAGLDYRHVLHVGGLIFMFGENTEEQRKAAWAEVMAEAEELAAGIQELDALPIEAEGRSQ